jgi:hypothetical protein
MKNDGILNLGIEKHILYDCNSLLGSSYVGVKLSQLSAELSSLVRNYVVECGIRQATL